MLRLAEIVVEGYQLNVQAIFVFRNFLATSATCCSAPTITPTLMWFDLFHPDRSLPVPVIQSGLPLRKGFEFERHTLFLLQLFMLCERYLRVTARTMRSPAN